MPGNDKADLWITYRGVDLYRLGGSAYIYSTSHIEIDADGAPNAYNPQDSGLDALANAGYPNGGWKSVLVSDPTHPDAAYVQQANDPYPRYFVAMTTLQDVERLSIDTRRYLDARVVPYIVFPGSFYEMPGTGAKGDLVMARNLRKGRQARRLWAMSVPMMRRWEKFHRSGRQSGWREPQSSNGTRCARGAVPICCISGIKE